ncbi:response regulator [Microbacterium trichothecenolyticum]|uniref:Transcriptional regulatory protein n=1 Tax=Microbacterium ureisolvens TaxID=2781186 RepID=A0ABS7HZV3_9MICO|nr:MULTISPECIES: response regulator [Microbacterium]MBW9110921.1 response regulator [Microbacterium ureisolvens]MBW9121073.1 response regulator [Microbacterium trichothecenolyticum]
MTQPLRVLVVDDDFRVAGLHRDVVASRAGFTALDPVHSLGAARLALRAHSPDLLLVDAFLPDGDGVEFVAAVDVDAFVLSAATDAATVRRALRAGALAYLTKPFEARVLAERLDRYARMRNLLGTDRPLEQEQIDRALTILHGSADATSVSRTATEQVILEGLGDGEASAAEVAERVGISRATAQRHLAALASRGQVEVRLRYGSTGRPEHRYAATR